MNEIRKYMMIVESAMTKSVIEESSSREGDLGLGSLESRDASTNKDIESQLLQYLNSAGVNLSAAKSIQLGYIMIGGFRHAPPGVPRGAVKCIFHIEIESEQPGEDETVECDLVVIFHKVTLDLNIRGDKEQYDSIITHINAERIEAYVEEHPFQGDSVKVPSKLLNGQTTVKLEETDLSDKFLTNLIYDMYDNYELGEAWAETQYDDQY